MLTPTFAPLRIEGSGDVYTYVGAVTYANGETWQMIQIIELRQGKIAKTTSWYAAPFEAPEWRARFVERVPRPGRLARQAKHLGCHPGDAEQQQAAGDRPEDGGATA